MLYIISVCTSHGMTKIAQPPTVFRPLLAHSVCLPTSIYVPFAVLFRQKPYTIRHVFERDPNHGLYYNT